MMLITTSIIMKTKQKHPNIWLQVLKNPLFILVMIIGSPFYIVHKLVQWTSTKTDKTNDNIELAVR